MARARRYGPKRSYRNESPAWWHRMVGGVSILGGIGMFFVGAYGFFGPAREAVGQAGMMALGMATVGWGIWRVVRGEAPNDPRKKE